jgi:hypothetical protein
VIFIGAPKFVVLRRSRAGSGLPSGHPPPPAKAGAVSFDADAT